MSENTPLDGTPKRIKQDQVLFLVLLIVLGVIFFVLVFALFKPNGAANPGKDVSLGQALTMVAGASQTAQAEQASPDATKNAFGTGSPTSSSDNSTQPSATRSPQASASLTRRSTSVQNNSSGPTSTFPVSNATVRPTYTPKPTETRSPTPTPTATFTPTSTAGPGLPGISMSAVTGRLENEKGFACEERGSSPGPILWMCDIQVGNDLWYHVDLYGSPGIEVTNLLVSVFQTYPDNAKAVDILGFVASLAYNGSVPSEARAWVVETLPSIQSVNDVREKFIGRVRFRLYGGPQGRYLEMGEPLQQ